MNGRINTAALHFVQLFEYSTLPVMASAVALLWVSISEVKTGSSFKQIKNYPSYCWPVYFSKEGLDAYLLYIKKKQTKNRRKRKGQAANGNNWPNSKPGDANKRILIYCNGSSG